MERALGFGSIICCSFPFTNHKKVKRRPALIIYKNDFIVIALPITSKEHSDFIQVPLDTKNINGRKLPTNSYINIDNIMTMEMNEVVGQYGVINSSITGKVKQNLKELFSL